MKRKFTFLITAALMLLSSLGWAQTEQIVASYSRANSTNTITGGEFETNLKTATAYYQDNSSQGTTYYMQIKNNEAYWTTTPSSISFSTKLGGGSTGSIEGYEVYVALLDADGNIINSSATIVTNNITTQNGSNFEVSIPATNNVYGVKLYHLKKPSYNVRYYNFSLSYVEGGGVTVHSLTFNADPTEGGTIVVGNNLTSPAEVAEEAELSISATANTGYVFSNWTVTGTGSSLDNEEAASTTFTMGTEDATLTANFTQVNTYTVTYYANNGSETKTEVEFNEGDDVTVADNTFSYAGHAFTKWNTIAGGTGTDYEPGTVIENISADIDLYAQWEESSETVDVLNKAFTGISGINFSNWQDKTGTSGAVYAGRSGGNNNSIQLNTSNPAGIVSTTSGGNFKKVVVTWYSGTTNNRTIQIYGSNTAYEGSADLYDTDKQGELLGSIVKGTSTELTILNDYAYIGIKATGTGIYLEEIRITWVADTPSTVATPTFSPASGTEFGNEGLSVTISQADNKPIYYTFDGSEPSSNSTLYEGAINLTTTTTIKARAYDGENASNVATATYTYVDPNAPGTVNNPYTVAEARDAIDAGTGVTGVYVTGIVYEGGSSLSSGSMNYWISDDGTATDKFEIYKGKSFSGNNFTSTNEVQPGDIVVVYGNITKYSSTYEFSSGSRLHSLKLVAPSFSPAAGAVDEGTEVTISDLHTDATIYYTTDGSTPTNESAAYDDPIEITSSMTIKAIAVKSGCTNSNVVIAAYTIEEHAATPTFSPASNVVYTTAQNVTISCETEGATIYYTIDGTTPTNESTVYSSAIPVSVTTTIKAIAVKAGMANSSVAEATYNISLTTMDAIFAKATVVGSTATSVYITFNNWVITGVNDSKHAFLSDGEKGCIIYVNDHGGFSEGDILSGTANCNVQLFNASAELTNITTATEGLTVTPGSSPTPRVTTIDALGAINSGSLVTLNDLTYNGSTLSDGVNTITPYNTIYSATLTNGKTYDVTGVFVLNNTTKRINPRREADIVLKADMSATVFSGLTAFTYLVDNGPSAAQHIELYGEDFAGDLTVTASGDYEVSTDNTTYLESVVVAHDEGDIAEDLYVRLKSGLATGDHNGTLTFTATNLTTVEQALEGTVTASATYDIMIDSSIAHGTVTTSASVAEAGDTITLTVTPDECYQFVEWVTEPDSLTWTSANQFTMPAEDVLISATFSQIVYTIQYSVNGVVESGLQEYVNCGSTASLWNEDELEIAGVELPTECSLLGWSSASGNTEILSSLEPEANATLYAVLAYGDTSYDLVTSVSELSVGDIIVIASNIYNYAMSTTQNTNNRGQAEITKTDNHITITTSVCEFVLGEGNVDNTWSFYDGTQSGYIYAASSSSNHLKTEASLSNNSSWEISISEGIASVTAQGSNTHNVLQHNNGSSLFSCYSSASQTAISLYKKHSSAYTNVLVENLTGDITLTEPTYIPAGTIVDAGNHTITTSAANLIIEDGGQLVHESDVQATVQKSVAAYTAKDGDGWYLIASPVDNYSTSTIATGTYDLFIYNEPNAYWYSSTGAAAPFNTLERGKGYLYANAANVNLNYAGTMKATDANIKVDLSYACDEYPYLKGFNLVGNPFTRNLTATDMVFGGTNVVSYYDFNADRTEFVTYQINERPIQPGQGFFIQATASEQKLVFNPTTPPTKDASDFKYISISAGDENFTDKAYIQFGYGNTLRKMTFGENTMVYVMNDDLDYAAARVEELAGTIPVHFVPIADGFYTITVETKNIENLNYMHLIDNIKNTEIDLLVEPSYTFKASESDNADRFYLVFDFNNYTGVNENYTNDNFAHQIGDEIFVSGEGTLQVFDVLGRFVTGYNVNGDKRISTAEFNTGVYIFRMVGTEVKTQKIIVR